MAQAFANPIPATELMEPDATWNMTKYDERCRACVVALWWPVAGGASTVALIGVIDDDPVEISPARP